MAASGGCGSWFQRRAAVRLLAERAQRGDRGAIAEAARALAEDGSADVREAAARALGQLAERGDREVLGRLCAALREDVCDVRLAALGALGTLAGPEAGSVGCIAAQAAPESRQSTAVRAAALVALRAAAESYWLTADADDDGGLQHLTTAAAIAVACARELDPTVAVPALAALPALAPAAPAVAEGAARAALLGSEGTRTAPRIRVAAVSSLAELASPGDDDALQVVRARLQDEDSSVRAAAVSATARLASAIAGSSLEGTIHALCTLVEDVCADVRCAVLEALGRLAPRGHQRAAFTAVQGLADDSSAVRQAASRALAQVAEVGGDDLLISAIGELLSYTNKDVRATATAALEVLCDPDEDDRGLRQLSRNLSHRLRHLRGESRAALERLGGRGRPAVVEACLAGLRCYDCEDTRRDAIRALQRFCAEEGDNVASDELAGVVETDPSPANRRAAVRALATVGRGREVAFRAAAAALVDPDEAVCEEAVGMFHELAAVDVDIGDRGRLRAMELLVAMLPLAELRPEQRAPHRLRLIRVLEVFACGSNAAVVVEALVELTVDFDLEVRLRAARALESVAAVGNADAVDAVAALLDCDDPVTRSHAASRFHLFAPPWDPEAAYLAAQRTRSEARDCRLAALQALSGVLDPGRGQPEAYVEPEEEVIEQLRHLAKEDQHRTVRSAALAILQHVEERLPMEPLIEGLGAHLRRVAGLQ